MAKFKLFLALMLLALVGVLVAGEEPKRVADYIAVMDLDIGEGVAKNLSAPLTNVVIDEMVRIGKYKVIDRANRDKILSETGFQLSGCADSSCQVEAGRLLGVGNLIVGRIDKLGDTYVIFLQFIDVQTASIDASARESCKCDEAGLLTTASNATHKLSGDKQVDAQPTPPPPAEPKPETKGKCSEDMAYIPEGNFCMDVYEYPNRKGLMPKGFVRINEARSLCKQLGKRLPTQSEWETACLGSNRLKYSYGNDFVKGNCMTGVEGSKIKKPVPSGTLDNCQSDYNIYDMVGNVYEWTDDGVSKYQWIRGGSYGSPQDTCNCYGKHPGSDQENSFRFGYGGRWGVRCAKDAE